MSLFMVVCAVSLDTLFGRFIVILTLGCPKFRWIFLKSDFLYSAKFVSPGSLVCIRQKFCVVKVSLFPSTYSVQCDTCPFLKPIETYSGSICNRHSSQDVFRSYMCHTVQKCREYTKTRVNFITVQYNFYPNIYRCWGDIHCCAKPVHYGHLWAKIWHSSKRAHLRAYRAKLYTLPSQWNIEMYQIILYFATRDNFIRLSQTFIQYIICQSHEFSYQVYYTVRHELISTCLTV